MNVPYPLDPVTSSTLPFPERSATAGKKVNLPPPVRSTTTTVTTHVVRRSESSSQLVDGSGGDSTRDIIDTLFNSNSKCLIKQKVENLELLTGWETKNAYQLHFGNGFRGFAKEESRTVSRQLLGASRPFEMKVYVNDPSSNKVTPLLVVNRPFKFIGGELEVRDHNKTLLGYVKKRFSVTSRKFVVTDHSGRECYSMSAHHVIGKCFSIYDSKMARKGEVGRIQKQWSGLLKEMFTDADNFGVEFPQSATSQEKALLLAATFIIDYLFFENNHLVF